MRYFKDSMDTKLIALPSDPHGSLSCWIHWDSNTFPNGHSITREHLKAWEALSTLIELTEDQARTHDPEMFSECLDRPYNDATSMLQFYIQRAQECVGFEPAVKQVEHYLIHECKYHVSGHVSLAIHAIERHNQEAFGILAYDKAEAHYVGAGGKTASFLYSTFREKIDAEKSIRLWWRYNTLEKNLSPEVFHDRMRRL